jgi:disulfide bond formation protein DsbB
VRPAGNASGWLLVVFVLALGAVAAALVSQHLFDMPPCPWCILQRLVFTVIALAALIGIVWRAAAGRIVAGIGVVLLAVAGMAAALWQHFVAAATASCNLTLADRIVSGIGLDALMPEVFQARASCADAAVDLLGVPYEFWSLALFGLLAVAGLQVLRGARGARR